MNVFLMKFKPFRFGNCKYARGFCNFWDSPTR